MNETKKLHNVKLHRVDIILLTGVRLIVHDQGIAEVPIEMRCHVTGTADFEYALHVDSIMDILDPADLFLKKIVMGDDK